ncbi:MAG: T9SS type A sorting domain-containing protein [Salinivirgaceae bacterium]|nr:T9SS type A sorting domain-containing protein [Salinivirgaceae bacterium]
MNTKITIATMLLGSLTLTASAQLAQVSPTTIPLVYLTENTGASFAKPPKLTTNQMESYSMLPDPFAWSDGSGRSEDFIDWEKRRNEIKAEVEYYEIGEKPEVDRDDVDASFENGRLTVTIKVGENLATLTSDITIPQGDGPFPVFISMGMSSLSGQFAGCATMSFNHDQVAKYGNDSQRYPNDQFNQLYPELYDNGNYSKWSWGVSRLIDGLEIVKENGQLTNLDLEHIAVSGCSYAGKMAMFAGAYDERVALTIAQEPGGGGASAWRTIDYTSKKLKKSVEGIGNTNYSWFMTSMQNFNGKQDILPHDHHELLAMCAPRALLVLGNPDMEWLCDYSTYITCRAVEKIYETFGIEDRFGFVIDGGHGHCNSTAAENAAVKAFVQKFMFGDTTANTMIRTVTSGSSYPTLGDMDEDEYAQWYADWKPADPNRPKIKIVEPTENLTYPGDAVPEKIAVKAEVEDINNDVAKVEFYVNGQLAKTAEMAPYGYELTGLNIGVYNVYAVATDSTGLYKKSNTVTITVETPIIKVLKAEVAPTIDGNADDTWGNAEKLFANNVLLGTGGNGSTNCSGSAQLLWDDNYIYVFCDITDDKLVNDGGNDVYKNDNVELYFDCNNSKGGSYDSDDVQFSFNYNSEKISTIPTNYGTKGINFVILSNNKGYTVEASIPWNTIKCKELKSGMKIGFEFMINDDDDGGDRENKISWNATSDNAYQNSSLFGTFTIIGEVDPSKRITEEEKKPGDKTGIDEEQKLAISLYPNPAKDFVLVNGIDGEFNYEILDIAGKIQTSGTASKRISVTKLSKGIYVVRIKDGILTHNLRFIKE